MTEERFMQQGEDFISHHGVLGMKWGVRNYQNSDGSLTEKGRKRYGTKSESKNRTRRLNDLDEEIATGQTRVNRSTKRYNRASKRYSKTGDRKYLERMNIAKNDISNYKKDMAKYKTQSKKLMDKYTKEGYDIKATTALRDEAMGAKIIGGLFGNLGGGYIGSTIGYNLGKGALKLAGKDAYAKGYKYKVSKNENGKRGTVTRKKGFEGNKALLATVGINAASTAATYAAGQASMKWMAGYLNQMQMQQNIMIANQEARRSASLAASGGTNPFMYG